MYTYTDFQVDCASESSSASVNVTDLKGEKHQRIKELNETVQHFVSSVLRYVCKRCFLSSVMRLFCRLLCEPLMTVVTGESEMHSLVTSRSVFLVTLLREPMGKKSQVLFCECLWFVASMSCKNFDSVTTTLAYMYFD